MLRIKYVEKGIARFFKRVDSVKYITAISAWTKGDLLYARLNKFEVKAIPWEDVISVVEL